MLTEEQIAVASDWIKEQGILNGELGFLSAFLEGSAAFLTEKDKWLVKYFPCYRRNKTTGAVYPFIKFEAAEALCDFLGLDFEDHFFKTVDSFSAFHPFTEEDMEE